MRTTVLGIGLTLLVLAAVPLALIAVRRAQPSPLTRIDPVPDMDKQPKFTTQVGNPLFADQRAMRPIVPGTQAREDGQIAMGRDEASYERLTSGLEKRADGKLAFVTELPVPVDKDLLHRGQARYAVYCAPCHGLSGYGDGMVARRAAEMQANGSPEAAGWVAPTSYHSDELRKRLVGHLYNTIANGIRSMPAYGRRRSRSPIVGPSWPT